MSETKFMYLRNAVGVPEVTIAYQLAGVDKIRFGYAVQNVDQDKWNRTLGRKIAEGRLNSSDSFVVVKIDPTVAHANNAQMAAIADSIRHADVPTRMRAGAQRWFDNMWKRTLQPAAE